MAVHGIYVCLLSIAAMGLLRAVEPSDPVAGRSHWAFQPLAVEKPDLLGADSVIDAFILAELRTKELKAAPLATPRERIRRLYFQLTGLPPSTSELNAALTDSRSDTWERLVESLLASPRFGERWGRHWLDLARYADSNGLDENFLFREAWRYRNWVVGAMNADQPFDRFVLAQIAGDLLPFDSIEERDEQRIAAGFLVMGPKVLLGNNANNQKMEVADEQIDTIGRSLLGLTLGCARCHDHKFEPVPTADYYALAGILTSTKVMEQRYMLGQQRVMERLVGLGTDGEQLEAAYEAHWKELPKKREALAQAKSTLTFLEKDDAEGLRGLLEKHPEAVAEGARDDSLPTAERLAAQKVLVADRAKRVANPPIPPRAMIPCDVESPGDEAIRLSGKFDQPGEKVPRGVLQVLTRETKIEMPETQSGRIELGRWLTDVENGAGELTARVLANRVWHHLMGVGLVRTVDNFGRTGELPSHPALLDHLASELIASDWSIKALIRQVVTSQAFARSSAHDGAAYEFDPDNRLWWRAHRRRLDPESLRDAMLMVAGKLDLAWTSSTVDYLGDQATAVGGNKNRRRTDFPCRSLYLPMIRNDLPELFEAFDFADPHATTGARSKTNDAKQGLFLLNDDMVMDAAEATARRFCEGEIGSAEERLKRAFEAVLGSPPSADEREALLRFLATTENQFTDDGEGDPSGRAWAMVCHALFSLSRFQFLE